MNNPESVEVLMKNEEPSHQLFNMVPVVIIIVKSPPKMSLVKNPSKFVKNSGKLVKNTESIEESIKNEEPLHQLPNMGITYYYYCAESTKPFSRFLKISFLH